MSLTISHIESLAQDRFSKDGITKQLHIVAKNIAFTIHVEATFNLNRAPLTAKLFYDFANGEPREVETLKVPPLESTSHVNESGDKSSVEIRIGVLSSQHEGAYFRVRLSAINPDNNKLVEVYSHPLKIISKRNQVKKIIAKQQQQQQNMSTSPQSSPLPSPPSPIRTSSSKEDSVAQALARMEEQQREQAMLLQKLYQQVSSPSALKRPADDLETAFDKFLDAFKRVSPEERPDKLRKVMKSSDNQKTMMEFAELVTAEGYAPVRIFPCSDTECAHKRELENLDLIYSEFLTDPISTPDSNLF